MENGPKTMPLRLEIKKELSNRSDRVKSVDIHSGENPWVLSALYNGNVYIWDYSNNVGDLFGEDLERSAPFQQFI